MERMKRYKIDFPSNRSFPAANSDHKSNLIFRFVNLKQIVYYVDRYNGFCSACIYYHSRNDHRLTAVNERNF